MDSKTIKARREAIVLASPCDGCGSTLESCLAQRGRDMTAPSWFGCCARGAMLDQRCKHVADQFELLKLVKEIEDGEVAPLPTPEDELLASIKETSRRVRLPRDGLFDGIYPEDYYAREEG